jgi:hypothetical protein
MRKLMTLCLLLFSIGAPLHARTVQLWVDVSGSVDREISAPIEESLANILTHGRGIDRVEVFGFASGLDALRTPTAVFNLSRLDASSCKTQKRELSIRTVRERHEEECEARQGKLRQEREKELASLSRRLVGQIQNLEKRPPSLSTCLFQVLLRCTMQGPGEVAVIVTDGAQENCPMVPRPSAMGGAQVIVLLVPKKGDDREAVKLLEERSRRIRAFSPITVVPLFQMENDLPGLIGK